MSRHYIYSAIFGSILCSLGPWGLASAADVKNVVIVHGALVDGSGWRAVSDGLTKKGYNVTIVQEPLTSLPDDVAATKRVLDLQDGPIVLVGHSYGGIVISEAGHAGNVAALVYVSGFEPEKGESVAKLQASSPVPDAKSTIKATSDGYLYLEPSDLPRFLATDIPKGDAEFIGRTQVFTSSKVFAAEAGEPAWKTKPSWAVIATKDRAINPDLERSMAKRAGSKAVELDASHFVFMSKPNDVVNVIVDAAKGASR